ncbi:chorismate-binding protein [Corynebacterium mastitidis]|uniref:anthranilate synthase n=1 Tax=Corynebacterium mastitidis TaxID=161890 RepID=A0ABU8NWV0_9CORY
MQNFDLRSKVLRTCSSSHTLVHRLTTQPDLEFAVLRREDSKYVEVLIGTVRVADELAGIPLDTGTGGTTEILAVVPFHQIHERGFEVIDDAVPLEYLVVEERFNILVDDFMSQINIEPVELRNGRYDQDDSEYAEIVRRVVEDEIGQGEGANFVIRRDFHASVAAWAPSKALTVFRNLIQREAGAYWTFYVQTKRHALLGASPERHVSSHGGTVCMNPISGTFRIPEEALSPAELRTQFNTFLHDRKEILELMMVVDEELKMIASICPAGGQVIGPFLKRMSRVVHTEYVLEGQSELDPREILRKSMFAATVLGSPVSNACRVIKKYEKSGRAHYGSVLALFRMMQKDT